MEKAILTALSDGTKNWFATSTRNTGMSQRATLEEIILNLATLVGASEVLSRTSARGSTFYAVGGDSFQSATNTDLSRDAVMTADEDGKVGRRKRTSRPA